MSAAIGPRWRGPASIALFAGLPALLLAWTIANGLAWLDAGAAYDQDAERVAQIEQRIRGASVKTPQKLDTTPIFLAAPSASLARAELQTRVTALIDRVGGRLIEVRAEDETPGGDPNGVLVRFTFDAAHARLVELLTAVEAGLPLLAVEGLNVRVQQSSTSEANPDDPVLRVNLSLRGYRREARP